MTAFYEGRGPSSPSGNPQQRPGQIPFCIPYVFLCVERPRMFALETKCDPHRSTKKHGRGFVLYRFMKYVATHELTSTVKRTELVRTHWPRTSMTQLLHAGSLHESDPLLAHKTSPSIFVP